VSDDEPFYLDAGDPPSKRAVLAAALELFARKGLAATTVREIADHSGFTNPALFRFFESKDALALYLFRRCYERLSRELAGAVVPGEPFAENLRHLIERYAEFTDSHPEALLYVNDNLRLFWPRVPETDRQRSIIGLSRRMLGMGIAEGAVATDVPVDLLVAALTGLLIQVARLRYFGETGPLSANADKLHLLAMRAVARPTS
jgi:AcrR family transcriptional regulator